MSKKIHNRRYLQPRRKNLRSNSTIAESTLWKYLKNEQTGRKFRRQHSIENYIVDFFCPQEKLIIELDGSHHNNLGIILKDEDRTECLTKLGYKVIRFENNSVANNCEGVIEVIKSYFKKEE